jgi:hypothetical protein
MRKFLFAAVVSVAAFATSLQAGADTCQRKDIEGRWSGVAQVMGSDLRLGMSCEWIVRYNASTDFFELQPGSGCVLVGHGGNLGKSIRTIGFFRQQGGATSCITHGVVRIESSPVENLYVERMVAEGPAGGVNNLSGLGFYGQTDSPSINAQFMMNMVRVAH